MRASAPEDRAIINSFTDLYWNQIAPWTRTKWRGHGIAKCPLDLFVYQEILWETKPDVLLETGSCIGGSALFFASIFDMIGHGEVVTADTQAYLQSPYHPRIRYCVGDSVSDEIANSFRCSAEGKRTMVCLDSLHTYEHVSRELEMYGPLVTPGCYLVVEDTNVDASWGYPAAQQAAREFVERNPGFEVDAEREYQLMTFNPSGWIRRNH